MASIGRVVRVLGELFGKIVEFGQLAQKRLGRHLCLVGGVVGSDVSMSETGTQATMFYAFDMFPHPDDT